MLRRLWKRLFGTRTDEPWIGECEVCHHSFEFSIINNLMADTAYAYCDTCGTMALLSGWYEHVPAGAPLRVQGVIPPELEAWLAPCGCGGTFKHGSEPRCPACRAPISAEAATSYIEPQAPGTKGGWRWQRTWIGPYGFLINRRLVQDNYRSTSPR